MRKLEPKTYETAAQLEERINEHEAAIARLTGPEKQIALKVLAKLRSYAQAKRWLERN
jgi:hypothetical protein